MPANQRPTIQPQQPKTPKQNNHKKKFHEQLKRRENGI